MFGLYLVLGILIQIYYPYPFVYPDSGAYLLSAAEEVVNAWRPMGYSYYIRFVHAFSPSLTVLYWVSYGLNAIACILFLFSVKYLFKITSKILFYTFAGFMIFSPSL
ncbi:MAG: hypothetical protein LBV57_04230, partial [Candidatus Symbiothrix sp.]|nr:hypothetical protein [Candidatus Symbiothrix sp.]